MTEEQQFYLKYQDFFNNIKQYTVLGKNKNTICEITNDLFVVLSIPYLQNHNDRVMYIKEKCPPYLYVQDTYLYFEVEDLQHLPLIIISNKDIFINIKNNKNPLINEKLMPFIICENLHIVNYSPFKKILNINKKINSQTIKNAVFIEEIKTIKNIFKNKSLSSIKNYLINTFKKIDTYEHFQYKGMALISDLNLLDIQNTEFIDYISTNKCEIENTNITETIIDCKDLSIYAKYLNKSLIINLNNINIEKNGSLIINNMNQPTTENNQIIFSNNVIPQMQLEHLEIYNIDSNLDLRKIKFTKNAEIILNNNKNIINFKLENPVKKLYLKNNNITPFQMEVDLELIKDLKFLINKNDYEQLSNKHKQVVIKQYINCLINEKAFISLYGNCESFKKYLIEDILDSNTKHFKILKDLSNIFYPEMFLHYIQFNGFNFCLVLDYENKVQYIQEIKNDFNNQKDNLVFEAKNIFYLDKEKLNKIINDNYHLN